MIDKGVHFVSRLKYGVKLYDLKGNEIVLGSLLKGKRRLDRWVYIGADKKVKVRLVMIPLPAGQTAEKRRKARQDRDRDQFGHVLELRERFAAPSARRRRRACGRIRRTHR